jgi:hypothetical protein
MSDMLVWLLHVVERGDGHAKAPRRRRPLVTGMQAVTARGLQTREG